MAGGLLGLISRCTTMKITRWAQGSDDLWDDDREPAGIESGANVVSSRLQNVSPFGDIFGPAALADAPARHAVLLDLDVPAYLIPSSTEGHSHLYIDVEVGEAQYFKLLDVLAECRVIDEGYAEASKSKGGTSLRLPWVKKGASE